MQGPISFIESRLYSAFSKIDLPLIDADFGHAIESSVSNGLDIEQTDTFGYFIMDKSQTFGKPDPPTLGKTETFTLGGIWAKEVTIERINFTCNIFGAPVYNEDTPFNNAKLPVGFWTTDIPFDVPGVAPSTKYDVTVTAFSDKEEPLFIMTTSFNF